MTLPPPALPELSTGNRGTRRRAPVSDRPGTSTEYLRLRHHKLSPARPFSDQTKALRTVVRTRDDVVRLRVMATNMLSALLDAFWPGAKALFKNVESPIALEFLTRYPTPASAAALAEKRMAAFCTKHGYSGRRTAEELVRRLRAAPPGVTAELNIIRTHGSPKHPSTQPGPHTWPDLGWPHRGPPTPGSRISQRSPLGGGGSQVLANAPSGTTISR